MGCTASSAVAADQEVAAAREEPDREPPPEPEPQPAPAPLVADKKLQLLDLLPGRGGDGEPKDVWIQASFALQLQKLLKEHPYLEPGRSAQPHPLQSLVDRCRSSSQARSFQQAQKHLHRLLAGIGAENELSAEAFRLFDLDKSGELDEIEFRHMCAYLGWAEDKVEVLDLNKDGKVTQEDLQSFIGYMGGVQQLFQKRGLRISTSRKDASHYSGLAVGSHVRAHYYVKGQKSSMFKEALVVAVDVEMKRFGGGFAMVGVLLEFAFGPGERWRARQVVPMNYVLGTVEDATVVGVMKEIGMLDGQQSLWALLLPDSELQAMRRLTPSQQDALTKVRRNATEKHDAALPLVQERFRQLNYSEIELQAVLGWVQDLAPLVVHVPLDEAGRFLETDEYFRNQFEIIILLNRRGKGHDEHSRFGWESRLFGQAYDKAEPFERVKYGAMNIMNDYKGVHSVRAFGYGDSYIVLKDVRLRTSFTYADSCCCNLSHMGTLDKYAHVLNCFGDTEIHAIVAVATAAIAPESEGGRQDIGAAQLELLRGSSQDPTSDWITVGFPGLGQQGGCHYFEVLLFEGCRAPQVGVLSSRFDKRPYTVSGQGVGDDEHGWAVDGQNCARWHSGQADAWGTAWPCRSIREIPKAGSPTAGASNERALSEDVVVGVAVNLDQGELLFSTNGVWDKSPAFVAGSIPKDVKVFPAISLRGRAAFVMGPKFRFGPPSQWSNSGSVLWPGTFGGIVRVDCPELGDSQILSGFKEYQVHGEVSLKRNVQRLVANPKYREKQKTERSYARLVPGDWPFSGSYRRTGASEHRTLYKNDSGWTIRWDPGDSLWKISEADNLASCAAWASPDDNPHEPPRMGWKVPDHVRGAVDVRSFQAALDESNVPAEDAQQIMEALEHKKSGMIYHVNGAKSLAEELKAHVLSAGQVLTPEAIWEKAVKRAQRQLLTEAGLPASAEVVETGHPHKTPDNWQREVKVPGALGLTVHFASKSCTHASSASFQILAGGLDREAAGPGARVELQAAGTKLEGTVVERNDGGGVWRVRLDQRTAEPPPPIVLDGDWSPAVGEKVEARSVSGLWYKATVSSVREEVDWYDAKRVPVAFIVDWADGEEGDREKVLADLRKPKAAALGATVVDDLPRYGAAVGTERFALCREEPKVVRVAYSGSTTVGSEIASFRLDTSYPLTPIHISSFSGSGPAQEQGVTTGWYLDVVSTVQQASNKEAFAKLFQGLGGMEPYSGGSGSQLTRHVNRLLDSAFQSPAELLARLNGGLLALKNVTLHLTNSASTHHLKLLPEAVATYGIDHRVSSEIKLFTSDNNEVHVGAFLKDGPAQTAGVRTDWVLDVSKTQARNPGMATELSQELLLENPNVLLSMANTSLVFRQPNGQKALRFTGSGPASSETWGCKELPGSSAVFKFTSRSGGDDCDPNLRWGAWALVLPKSVPRMSVQDLDALSQRWVSVMDAASGTMGSVEVERDEWDEVRLRALCRLHGWEFEWMTEDGERRRRANERQAFLKDGVDLTGTRQVAEDAAIKQREEEEKAVEAAQRAEAEEAKAADTQADAADAPAG